MASRQGRVDSIMRLFAVFLAVASISLVFRADALALGEIEVRSMLNEPLDAQVPLVAASSSELSTLVVSPASAAAFETAGLELTGYVAGLQFEVVPGASPFVRVRGRTAAREPFLDLLLEFSWGSGRLLRNYTILLDPPAVAFQQVAQAEQSQSDAPAAVEPSVGEPQSAAPARPVAPAPADTAQPITDPAFNEGVGWVDAASPETSVQPKPQPRTRPAAAASAPTVGAARGTTTGRYGPVKKSETLWSIAYRLRPDPSLSMDQMQLAIFYANPEAFDGNLNTLKAGATLAVPSAADVASVDPETAKQEVARQRRAYVPPVAPVASPRAERPAAPRRPEPTPTQDQPIQQPAVAEPPVPETGSAITEDATPTQREPETPEPVVADSQTAAAGGADEQVADSDVARAEPARSPQTSSEQSTPPASREPSAGSSPPAEQPMSALERLRAQQAGRSQEPQPSTRDDTDVETELAAAPPATEGDAGAKDLAAEPDEPPATRPVQQPSAPAQPVDDEGGFPWLLLLLVLVAGGAGYWFWKRRQAAEEPASIWPTAPQPAPVDVSQTETDAAEQRSKPEKAAPAAAAPVADDLMVATAVYDAGDAEPTAPQETGETAGDLDATAIFDAGNLTAPGDEPSREATPASESTQQFHSETIMIDVSGDDPVAEADFHLAYGLYDEAALLLQQAMQAEPGRADVKAKLAEVYFAASQRAEFIELAEQIQDELSSAEWQRVIIMGQQLAPDEAIFQQDEVAGFDDAGLDLDFDAEPDTAAPATDFDLDDFGADETAEDEASLAFEIEPPTVDSNESTKADAGVEDDGHSLEFELEDFDADVPSSEPEPEPASVADEVDPESAVAADIQDRLAFDIDTMTSDAPLYTGTQAGEDDAEDVLAGLEDFEVGSAEAEPSTDDHGADDGVADEVAAAPPPQDIVPEFPDEPALSEAPVAAVGIDDSVDVESEEASDESSETIDADEAEAFLGDLDDFVVDAEESPSLQSPEPQPEPPLTSSANVDAIPDDKPAGDEPAFDFDLGDFDLGDEAVADAASSGESDLLSADDSEIDLDQFDFESDGPAEPALPVSTDATDFDLDAMFDDDDAADVDSDTAADADLGGKLDLARAYVDMGDAEMANSLIDDVLAGGNDEQKAEAATLKNRLSGGS